MGFVRGGGGGGGGGACRVRGVSCGSVHLLRSILFLMTLETGECVCRLLCCVCTSRHSCMILMFRTGPDAVAERRRCTCVSFAVMSAALSSVHFPRLAGLHERLSSTVVAGGPCLRREPWRAVIDFLNFDFWFSAVFFLDMSLCGRLGLGGQGGRGKKSKSKKKSKLERMS